MRSGNPFAEASIETSAKVRKYHGKFPLPEGERVKKEPFCRGSYKY
jgi:hypothetical protein